jgi:hypothetical protein
MSNRKRLLDAYGYTAEVMHFDTDGSISIQEIHDVEPTAQLAKDATEIYGGQKTDGMRLEAMIPADVMNRSYREGWFHDKSAWKRWANDPSNKIFRVEHNGRINTL